LTAKNIVDAYRSAFYTATGAYPAECYHVDGRWFKIDGIERDRGWVVLEVERLRQEALARAIIENDPDDSSRGPIFKLIRRLRRF
jgi:hypothetical protein